MDLKGHIFVTIVISPSSMVSTVTITLLIPLKFQDCQLAAVIGCIFGLSTAESGVLITS